MSSGPPPGGLDEAQVHDRVRAILDPLGLRLQGVATVAGLGLLFGCPAVILVARGVGCSWPAAVLAGVLLFGVITGTGIGVETGLVRRARDSFDRQFPPGRAGRTVALQALTQLEAPNRAGRRLRDALEGASPGEVVPPPAETPEQQVEKALGQFNPPPPASPGPTRPGGYYDYIPLELPAQDEKEQGRQP